MSSVTDPKRPQVLAAAAWSDLLGLRQAYQAAVMRQDQAEIERIRAEAHDMLDVTLDHDSAAATAVRSILGD